MLKMSSQNISLDMPITLMLIKRRSIRMSCTFLNLKGKVLKTSICKLGKETEIKNKYNEKKFFCVFIFSIFKNCKKQLKESQKLVPVKITDCKTLHFLIFLLTIFYSLLYFVIDVSFSFLQISLVF